MTTSRDIRIRNKESDDTSKQQGDKNPRSRIEFGTRIVVNEKVAKEIFDNAMKGIGNDSMKGAPYAKDIEDAMKKFQDMDSIDGLPIQGDKQEMVTVLSSLAFTMHLADKMALDKMPLYEDMPDFKKITDRVMSVAQTNERVRYALKELHIPNIEEIQAKMGRSTDITHDRYKRLNLNVHQNLYENRAVNYWQRFKHANDTLEAVRCNTPIELDAFLSEAAFLVYHANENPGKAHMEELKRGILKAIEPMAEERLLRDFLPNDLPEKTRKRTARR